MSIKSTKRYLWAQKVMHKMLFMSTKSYAQDVVYEHKMSTDEHRWTQDDPHRCCLRAQDVIYEHKKA